MGGKIQKSRSLQALGSHVDDLVRTVFRPADGLLLLAGGQAGIDVGRRHAALLQRHDLILHQCDQGRYHQRDTRKQQSGQLIADGFARSRGHNPENVPSAHQRPNQVFLALPKGVVAKPFFKGFC